MSPALLTRDLLLRLDPAALMAAAGFSPDPWQERVLRSSASRVLLLCCRQAGKSTVSACLALHEAVFHEGSLVLLLSPSLRQSQELFRKVNDFRSRMPVATSLKEESALRLEFGNGSRIVALPGNEETVRGFSGVRLLIIDEAARVPDSLYLSVRPMLAVSGGRILCLSTPFGRRGFFFEEYTSGVGWERVRITAAECPRISETFLGEERASLGPRWFAQEYECEFGENVQGAFSYQDIEASLDSGVRPLWE